MRNKKNGAVLGSITIHTFPNDNGLIPAGSGLYVQSEASGDPVENIPGSDGSGDIEQFFLELSNVNAATELVNLIKAQKVYEMNMKVIKVADSIMQSNIDLVK